MVRVALVREDVLHHAIWTVAVVSNPVVADHHRHHSWELELVEAPVMEIADVIAHAMHFRLSLLLSHQQVEKLEAILEIQEVAEVAKEVHEATDEKEHQDHQRR